MMVEPNHDISKAGYLWGYTRMRDAVMNGEDIKQILPAVTAEANKRLQMAPVEGALACLLVCFDALCTAGRYTLTADQQLNFFIEEANLLEKELILGRFLREKDWPQLARFVLIMARLVEEQRQRLQWKGILPFATKYREWNDGART